MAPVHFFQQLSLPMNEALAYCAIVLIAAICALVVLITDWVNSSSATRIISRSSAQRAASNEAAARRRTELEAAVFMPRTLSGPAPKGFTQSFTGAVLPFRGKE